MNFEDMQAIWTNQNELLDEAISVDSDQLDKVQTRQAKSIMFDMMWARIVEAVMFFTIVCALWIYIVNNLAFTAPVISAAVLNLFAIVGLAGNIGQIALIANMDYSLPLKQVQQQVLEIKSHGLAIAKLIILSIPLYMAYVFLGFDVLVDVDLYPLMSPEMTWIFAGISVVLYLPVFYVIKQMGEKSTQAGWAKKLCHFIAGNEWLQMTAVLNSFEQKEAMR